MTLTMAQAKHVACWRDLRKPFVLPLLSLAHHQCQWERIDVDLFGCTLCSSVHACCEDTCMDKLETDDGVVCRLSGILIRTCRFVEDEYMDNVHLVDCQSSTREFDEDLCHPEIERVIFMLLTSETTRKLLMLNLLKQLDKMKHLVRTHNVMDASVQFLRQTLASQACAAFNSAARKNMATTCVADCFRVMRTMVHAFHMPLKFSDTLHIAAGTLYLMRSGVHVHGLCILPRHAQLQHMLPPESSLDVHYSVRTKSITDAENLIKRSLRRQTRESLLQAGFRALSRDEIGEQT